MTKKVIITVLLFLIGGLAGYLFFELQNPSFRKLTPAERHKRIIEERDYAIDQAVKAGTFKCCIEPPCTMCYMEANQWNNHQAGTCACDDLVAQGEEPCPQCERGLCSVEKTCGTEL